jgi:hypothetical protein
MQHPSRLYPRAYCIIDFFFKWIRKVQCWWSRIQQSTTYIQCNCLHWLTVNTLNTEYKTNSGRVKLNNPCTFI